MRTIAVTAKSWRRWIGWLRSSAHGLRPAKNCAAALLAVNRFMVSLCLLGAPADGARFFSDRRPWPLGDDLSRSGGFRALLYGIAADLRSPPGSYRQSPRRGNH